jgi:hypothetical protein
MVAINEKCQKSSARESGSRIETAILFLLRFCEVLHGGGFHAELDSWVNPTSASVTC